MSLEDMKRVHLENLFKVVREALDEEWLSYISGDRSVTEAKKELEFRLNDFKNLGFRSAMKQCQTMLDFIGNCDGVVKETQKEEWRIMVRQYMTRIQEDLTDQMAFVIDPWDLGFITTNQFSARVQIVFPEAVNDMEEAGKCFALERYTACAFHLMRVAEHGFSLLREKYNVRYTDDWQKFINHIQGVLNGLEKRHNDTTDKNSAEAQEIRAEQRVLETSKSQIENIKRRWRDPTMHVRKSGYSKSQADEVFSSIKWFMNELVDGHIPDEPGPDALPEGMNP